MTVAAQHDTAAGIKNSITTVISPSQISRRDSLTNLYLPSDQGNRGIAEQVKDVYEAALEFHRQSFPNNGKLTETWISKSSSLNGVLIVLGEARAQYETKRSSRSKAAATCVSWWTEASARIMKYSQVVDTLVSSNPEYAALVWGGLRFLFAVTLNHEKLSTGIAQTLCDILEALSDVDILAFRLYPNQYIQQTGVELYANVLEFCIRATKWYRDVEKSFAKKVLRSFKDSWAFEFEDLKANIEKTIGRLKDRSLIAHQAETRDSHIMVETINAKVQGLSVQTGGIVAKFQDINDRIDELHGFFLISPNTGRQSIGNPSPLRVNPPTPTPINLERTLQHLTVSFDPQDDLKHGLALRKQRRDREGSFFHPALASSVLLEWISKPSSSLVRLKGSFIRRRDARDFALDIITCAKSAKLPVVWFLSSAKQSLADPLILTDVFKSLSRQIIEQHVDLCEKSQINEQVFDTCRTTEDWMHLFLRLLSLVSHIVLIIDAHEKVPVISDILGQFWTQLMKQRISTIVKMLFIVYNNRRTPLSLLGEGDVANYADIDLNKSLEISARRTSRLNGREGPHKLKKAVTQFARLVDTQRENE